MVNFLDLFGIVVSFLACSRHGEALAVGYKLQLQLELQYDCMTALRCKHGLFVFISNPESHLCYLDLDVGNP